MMFYIDPYSVLMPDSMVIVVLKLSPFEDFLSSQSTLINVASDRMRDKASESGVSFRSLIVRVVVIGDQWPWRLFEMSQEVKSAWDGGGVPDIGNWNPME